MIDIELRKDVLKQRDKVFHLTDQNTPRKNTKYQHTMTFQKGDAFSCWISSLGCNLFECNMKNAEKL